MTPLSLHCKSLPAASLGSSFSPVCKNWGFAGDPDSKESFCSAGGPGSIPESGRSPEEGNGTPLQDSCLENPMDRGSWRATVQGAVKSQTRLSDRPHTRTGKSSLRARLTVHASRPWTTPLEPLGAAAGLITDETLITCVTSGRGFPSLSLSSLNFLKELMVSCS